MIPQPLRRFCAILIGITFLVSGLLKIMDPVGTMLIVTEYFKFLHLGFLVPAAKVFGVLLAAVEALTGLALVTGVIRRVAAWVSLVLVGFFTLITLVLLIANPSMDCGCFGEAFHLSHLQSFLKNVVLSGLAAAAFLPMRSLGRPFARKWVGFGLTALAVLYAILYSNTHLPVLDFTDFRSGSELMASLDEEDDYDGPLPILSFRDSSGEYLDTVAASGRVIVFSVYNPASANWERLHHQFLEVTEAGATALLLVASYPAEVDSYGIPIDLPVLYADYKTLITLNRSNGGATYICDGEIIAKWHQREFPAGIGNIISGDPEDVSSEQVLSRRLKAQGFALTLAAVLFLL